jgi:DNA-binding NtrC family response regulator
MTEQHKLELLQLLMNGVTWEEVEKLTVEAALFRHKGNRTHASQELGICIRTMRNKIARYGLGEGSV